jgi:hypothetical protein
LYLFLVTVCDGQGLSYYSDASIMQLLKFDPPGLARARQELINVKLIAYQCPLYQVLALDAAAKQIQPPAGLSDPGLSDPVASVGPSAQPTPQTSPEPSEPTRLDQILWRLIDSAQDKGAS